MKYKLLSIFVAVTALTATNAGAVTLALGAVTNSTTGFITLDPDNTAPFPPGSLTDGAGRVAVSGRAIFLSVTTSLTGVAASMNALLASATTTPLQFDTALNSLITSQNTLDATTNPGIVRTIAYASGALTSSGSVQLGNSSNKTYLFLVAEAGGFITGIGAYTGPNVPTSGSVTFTVTSAGDTLGVGTSVLAPATTQGVGVPFTQVISGYQLAAAVPEPSAALLGAIGALGLLRRRRI